MKHVKPISLILLRLFFLSSTAISETPENTKLVTSKPYRTFITIKAVNQEQPLKKAEESAQIRLELQLPGRKPVFLPEKNKFWTLRKSESQKVEQTFEIPYAVIQNDGFQFDVTMVKKGKTIQPCHFEVKELSQFNRTYFCRTDVNFQLNQQHIREDKITKQEVEIRVFSDVNTHSKDLPKKLASLEP
ncbi:MAG: hypothetical protein EB078_05310 [Proteobacteria bacterium]|nr:hypothetical protein [Pseudomonadota bacterium]NDC23016.1 hypothetical protein [Pseudomonadota bacterium]NDD04303.1 hypothetical protein [Pseudomonadota bacterium]NDG26684.1 hypothetical protein [Pseudomonadota bacterium]